MPLLPSPAVTKVWAESGTSFSQWREVKNCRTLTMSSDPRDPIAASHPESNSQIGRLPKKSPIAPDSSATLDFALVALPPNLALKAKAASSSDWEDGTDYNAAFVAHWKEYNPDNKPSGILTYDGNHFNDAGHRFVAERMLAKFK